ncbi:MAG: bile acid:sodium symporter family protein [Woeseiaceae bacterium]
MDLLDAATLNFSADALLGLNVLLALIIFGIALDIKLDDFSEIRRRPKPLVVGLLSQLFLLPAITFGFIWVVNPPPSLALGLLLVAACPGGTVSNFLATQANGNVALSVSLSTVSSLLASVMTPFSIAFWGGRLTSVESLLSEVGVNFEQMFAIVVGVLIAPTLIGCWVGLHRPELARRLRRPLRSFSIAIFVLFISIAFVANWSVFLAHVEAVAGLVIGHNVLAFAAGYLLAMGFHLDERDRRTICIETGIQNTALGLTLVFTFFGGLGGMALVAASWGIWHLIGGGLLAAFWRRRPLPVLASV